MEQRIQFCTTTDGVSIAYATMGAGPPLVQVVGWLTHLEYDFRFPLWRLWAERLSAHHLLIRYDGRGVGLSDRAVDDLSLEARVRNLEAVVDATGLPRVALLGTSEGGQTAVAYAARHPDRVSRLIVAGAYPHSSPAAREFRATLAEVARQGWGADSPVFRQMFTFILYPDADADTVRAFTELERVSTTPDLAAARIVAGGEGDVRALLGGVHAPTLIVYRQGTTAEEVEGSRLMAARIPGARFLPLPGRNHLPLPGEPEAEQFLDAVLAFLAEDSLVPRGFPDGLSEREVAVLRLLAAGKTNREIADWLVISPNTVVRHVSNIFDKTGVANRAEAARYANRHGLVE